MGEKKKIFISMPFSGLPDEYVIEEQNKIVDKYFPGYEVINRPFTIEGWKPINYITHDLVKLPEADIIVFAPTWKNSRGCRAERYMCENYGLEFIEINKGED